MSFQPVSDSFSGLPLAALPAIVFDTETTGLNVAEDRAIEIGAVRLETSGSRDRFAALVNPGIPIPPASTRIHTISDTDVADAKAFSDVMAAFADWTGPSVVIGYSVGFDLGILKAEHDRHGIDWRPPRALDVRHLVQLLAPDLPSQSLETAAAWLEIEITDRHRAMGDALVTAQIFKALIPRLRDRGIGTLAQAERACRTLASHREAETRQGWQSGAEARSGPGELARIDSFPYRHRAADLMNAPPIAVSSETPLRAVLSQMMSARISSLYLAPDGTDGGYGIITERDVLRALDTDGPAALDRPAGPYGCRPLVTIPAEEFVYRALARMSGGGFRHLGVVDSNGTLVGALSARDLLRQRASDAVSLGDALEASESPAALGRVWSGLTTVARALRAEDVDARDIAALISRELRALTKRACELAEHEIGPPPAPYTMLVLGSGGRGESLLAMDQDNAIITADGAPDDWYHQLGTRVSDILADAGVAYCKGGIMASTPEWRMTLSAWRETVRSWIARSQAEDLMNCDIFFDAVPVHGDGSLADTLQSEARTMAANAPTFLKFLALNATRFDSPVGWFGRLRTDSGRVDLKIGGIMPVFSAARVVALKHGIEDRATPARLSAAKSAEPGIDTAIDTLIEAHRVLLSLILDQQLHDIDQGLPLSNKVSPSALGSLERQELKWALDSVPAVRDLLGTPELGT